MEVVKYFGQGSVLIMRVAEMISNKSCISAWIILLTERESWFTIHRIYKKHSKKVKNTQLINKTMVSGSK